METDEGRFPRRHRRGRRRCGSAAARLIVIAAVAVAGFVLLVRANRRGVQIQGARRTAPASPNSRTTGADAAAVPARGGAIGGDFHGCPVAGDGGDRELNRLKNRSYEGAYAPVSLAELLVMPWPVEYGGKARAGWFGRARALVAPQESRAVSLEGYLVKARASGPESTNCHGDDARYRDYHLWISAAPGEGRERSVIAEMTPRLRAAHANWNLEALNGVVSRRERVRASGWLLLDQEHPDQIGKTRGTVWEVHPVTRFEVQRGGRWIALDDVAFARRARRGR